jgi:hypothetical protein
MSGIENSSTYMIINIVFLLPRMSDSFPKIGAATAPEIRYADSFQEDWNCTQL